MIHSSSCIGTLRVRLWREIGGKTDEWGRVQSCARESRGSSENWRSITRPRNGTLLLLEPPTPLKRHVCTVKLN